MNRFHVSFPLRRILMVLTLLVLFPPQRSEAQVPLRKDQPDMTIDAKTKQVILDAVLAKLDQKYVDPAVARSMRQAMTDRRRRNAYEAITSASAFSDSVTEALRAVSHDKHLRVFYRHEPIPQEERTGVPSAEERQREEEAMRLRNYGFEQVERLRGNVGYLKLRGFMMSEQSGKAAAAAMQLLANTDALIIDLRQNGGGAGEMVQLLVTYLTKAGDPVRITDIYSRPEDFTQQFWTLPWVPGPRYEKDVYVLTSAGTFSAAEEFTYDLQNMKRATIVGETTGGGAHPVSFERLNEHFMLSLPYAKAVNPVSKTNWEGVGVKPDVSVPAADALKTAHVLALKKIQPTLADAALRESVAQTIESIEKTGESRSN